MENLITKNWVKFLAQAMKEQGCPSEVRTPEDVIENLYYLSKEDSRGSRFIPLQYKRIVEKLVCGLFNSALEYEDGKDVYFEKIGDTTVCTANVFWVKYTSEGRQVLGHGFHSMALADVMPGIYMTEQERTSKWKATVIGAAKSRALYDGGIGLEFYGDIFAPETDSTEEVPEEASSGEEKFAGVHVEKGMPIPQPKRGRKKKEETPVEASPVSETPVEEMTATSEATSEPTPTPEPEPTPEAPEVTAMSKSFAEGVIADIGNYAGMTLGDIFKTNPKNLVFLARNSQKTDVIEGAKVLILEDKELSAKYGI